MGWVGCAGWKTRILSFGWVRYEEVAVEVLYEVVEFRASECVELLFCVCGNDHCGVVSVGVNFGVWDCVDDVIDV